MKRSLLAVVLSIGGCHATTSLDPPEPPAGTKSMLLFAVADGYRLAFAVDVPGDGSAPAFPTFTRPREIDLYSVNFTCPLDVLGLKAGRQSLLAEPAPRLELPAPRSVLSSHDGAEQTPWADADATEIDDALRSVELPERNLCRLYGIRLAPLDATFTVGTSTPTAIVPRKNGKAIVANADGTFYELDADRNARQLTQISTDTPNRAGFEANDGTLWMVGRDGTVAHGDPEVGMSIVQTRGATISDLTLVDGARVGPTEIYRTSFQGPLERFDGTGWRQLARGVGMGEINFEYGAYSVAWIKTNEAVASGISTDSNQLLRYRDNVLSLVGMPEGERPTAVAFIPGLGLIVGTRNGRIIREHDGDFEVEHDSRIDSQVRTIVPTNRGFFYGRTSWGSWDPVAGYCPIDIVNVDSARVVALGDRGFLLMGGLLREGFLFVFERTDVEDPCLEK